MEKRGPPHAHSLVRLENKFQSDVIDNIIRTELPNHQEDADLFKIVKTHMIHGPCGQINYQSVWMKDSRSTKCFLKKSVNETIKTEDRYPNCKRRLPKMGGAAATIKVNGDNI